MHGSEEEMNMSNAMSKPSDPMPGKSSDFVVRLDGLNLDDGARDRIASALQASVLAELGRLDLGHKTGGLAYFPRKEWLGIWLRSIADIKGISGQDFNKVLNVTERPL
jgi:hypothetical protein